MELIAEFRTSAYELEIERCRHLIKPILPSKRVCNYCAEIGIEAVEDEHFFMKCPLYENKKGRLTQTDRK